MTARKPPKPKDPIPPATVTPAEEPLPLIYEMFTHPGVWLCRACNTMLHPSNVEPHRARHQRDEAIRSADAEIVGAALELELETDTIDTHTFPLERLVAAILARKALTPNEGPSNVCQSQKASSST